MPKLLKKFLVNALLKRGATKFEELTGKKIRHGMSMLGAALITHGYMMTEQMQNWEVITGGAVALGAIVLSDLRVYIQKKLGE